MLESILLGGGTLAGGGGAGGIMTPHVQKASALKDRIFEAISGRTNWAQSSGCGVEEL